MTKHTLIMTCFVSLFICSDINTDCDFDIFNNVF